MKTKLIILLALIPVWGYSQIQDTRGSGATSPTTVSFNEDSTYWATQYDLSSGLATKTTASDIATQIDDSLANIQAKVYNVLDYGAVSDTSINSTAAFNACIAAAGNGSTVLVPGAFRVDSVLITKDIILQGRGGFSYTASSSSIIYSRTDKWIIHMKDPAYGATVRDLMILGDTTSTSQVGIKISGETENLVERVYIANCGSHAIYLDPTVHTTSPKISRCLIENNTGDGIFAVTNGSYQINAVTIENCHILGNDNGLRLGGLINTNILNNVIEGNDSIGIFLSGRISGAQDVEIINMNITGNYIEQNVAGNIIAESWISGGKYQRVFGLNISDNYMYLTNAISSANANIVLRAVSGTSAHEMFRNLNISNRYYGGDLYNVSGVVGSAVAWSYISPSAVIQCTEAAASYDTYYNGLWCTEGGPTIKFESDIVPARYKTITATGITELHDKIRCVQGSAIDITADPQIVDGIEEQEIILIGTDNTNTLTLDDGTGIQLNGGSQCILGEGDMIKLIYLGWLDAWYEQWRVNN